MLRRVPTRALQAVLLCVVMVVMLGAGSSRSERLGHQMICMCGCNQILMECNHVGCPVSPVMLTELQTQLGSGAGDTAVLNWFAAKYGPIVLASPIRGGFDNVAWIVPISVFLLATIGTAFVIWNWRRRTLRLHPGAGSPLDAMPLLPESPESAMRERIRRETEYR